MPPQTSAECRAELVKKVLELTGSKQTACQHTSVQTKSFPSKEKLAGRLQAVLYEVAKELGKEESTKVVAKTLEKLSKNKKFRDELATPLWDGINHVCRRCLMEFLLKLEQNGFPMPNGVTGAFWSRDEGHEQARQFLSSNGDGRVLADTPLGILARELKISKHMGIVPFLHFWGTVSALYAAGMNGIIHVFLPEGLVIGSHFWNDELPMLRMLQREGRITLIMINTYDKSTSTWQPAEELGISCGLKITKVYTSDRKGENRYTEKAKKAIGTFDDQEHSITLTKPVRTAVFAELADRFKNRKTNGVEQRIRYIKGVEYMKQKLTGVLTGSDNTPQKHKALAQAWIGEMATYYGYYPTTEEIDRWLAMNWPD